MTEFSKRWIGRTVDVVTFGRYKTMRNRTMTVTDAYPLFLELDNDLICDCTDVPQCDAVFVWYENEWHPMNPQYDNIKRALESHTSEFTAELYDRLEIALNAQGYKFNKHGARIDGIIRIPGSTLVASNQIMIDDVKVFKNRIRYKTDEERRVAHRNQKREQYNRQREIAKTDSVERDKLRERWRREAQSQRDNAKAKKLAKEAKKCRTTV